MLEDNSRLLDRIFLEAEQRREPFQGVGEFPSVVRLPVKKRHTLLWLGRRYILPCGVGRKTRGWPSTCSWLLSVLLGEAVCSLIIVGFSEACQLASRHPREVGRNLKPAGCGLRDWGKRRQALDFLSGCLGFCSFKVSVKI